MRTLNSAYRVFCFFCLIGFGSANPVLASVAQFQGQYIGNAYIALEGVVSQPETVTGVAIADVDANGNITFLNGDKGTVNAAGTITWNQPNGLFLQTGTISDGIMRGNGVSEEPFVTTRTRIELVLQGGGPTTPTLSLTPTSRDHSAAAASGQSISVASNVDWTAVTLQNWITVNSGSGSGDGSVTYSLSQNTGPQRSGTITVNAGGVNRNFSIVQAGTGSWFAGASDLGSGWRYLPWLRSFNISQDPWIYHAQHGWLFPFGENPANGMYFWDVRQQTFLYTTSGLYPTMFRFADSKWIRYQIGSSNPRWFADLQAGVWESVE